MELDRHRLCENDRPNPVCRGERAGWDDWRWQMRNRIRSLDELSASSGDWTVTDSARRAATRFPMAITPYYASLIRKPDASDPIFAMSVPRGEELFDPPFLSDDPMQEERNTPTPGLVRRYNDRALLISTSTCASLCRHCTRKRVSGRPESVISPERLGRVVAYLREHPEIRDVIVSGGDPLTLATAALDKILAAVRSVPSVEIVRVGSRTPVNMPMRITDELVSMLGRHQPLWINTHFNHPRELTRPAAEACKRLADAGIPLGNQTVLLRGVNDDPDVLENLFRSLLRIRVRPYYLLQCDLVRGVEHFRTPLLQGVEIMKLLRRRLTGLAVPTFVVDIPNCGGKIPLLPGYLSTTADGAQILCNLEGQSFKYPQPVPFPLTSPAP